MAANSKQTAKKRGPGRPFEKGQSGNPSGRPKIPEEVRDAARAHTAEAIDTLVELMRGEDDKLRLKAACALLDRGWGKPLQSIEASGKDGTPIELTTEVVFVKAAQRKS